MTVFGVMVITSQAMLRDSMATMPKSMALMTLLGDLTASLTHILTVIMCTIGMIRVMLTFATPVEVMDAPCAEDMDMATEMLSSAIMVTTSRLPSVLDIITFILDQSQDHPTVNTDTALEVAIHRDGPMAMETDMELAMEKDTDSLTDGVSIMDMVTETQAQRDQSWVMDLVQTLQFHSSTSMMNTECLDSASKNVQLEILLTQTKFEQ